MDRISASLQSRFLRWFRLQQVSLRVDVKWLVCRLIRQFRVVAVRFWGIAYIQLEPSIDWLELRFRNWLRLDWRKTPFLCSDAWGLRNHRVFHLCLWSLLLYKTYSVILCCRACQMKHFVVISYQCCKLSPFGIFFSWYLLKILHTNLSICYTTKVSTDCISKN